MNNRVFMWSCLVMTFFVACQQAEVSHPEAENLRLSISASITNQGQSPQSRYAGSDPSHVDFVEHDRIGVFMDGEPAVEWTYQKNSTAELHWKSAEWVYWPDKDQPHTFHAFYPYEADASLTAVPMPDLSEQDGTWANICEFDFLVATASQSYGTNGVVSFEDDAAFTHVSSLLQLTFKGDGDLSTAVLNKITLEGADIVTPSTYSFRASAGEAVQLKSSASADVLTITPSHTMNGADMQVYFILNEKESTTGEVSLTVEYTKDSKVYVAHLDGLAGNAFVGGTHQWYTLVIKDGALVISGASISDWEGGESLGDVEINGEKKDA